MAGVGRPTELNDELCLKIRALVLEGKTLEEIAEINEIPFKTLEGWVTRNYHGFADKWRLYRVERRLKVAEDFGDKLMEFDDGDNQVLKLKHDEAKFVRETLGKETYSKKTESDVTSGGKPIVMVDPTIAEKYAVAQGSEGNSEKH